MTRHGWMAESRGLEKESTKTQGLKPFLFVWGFFGTAEAVPFRKQSRAFCGGVFI
jgi:hypothetical protein